MLRLLYGTILIVYSIWYCICQFQALMLSRDRQSVPNVQRASFAQTLHWTQWIHVTQGLTPMALNLSVLTAQLATSVHSMMEALTPSVYQVKTLDVPDNYSAASRNFKTWGKAPNLIQNIGGMPKLCNCGGEEKEVSIISLYQVNWQVQYGTFYLPGN